MSFSTWAFRRSAPAGVREVASHFTDSDAHLGKGLLCGFQPRFDASKPLLTGTHTLAHLAEVFTLAGAALGPGAALAGQASLGYAAAAAVVGAAIGAAAGHSATQSIYW